MVMIRPDRRQMLAPGLAGAPFRKLAVAVQACPATRSGATRPARPARPVPVMLSAITDTNGFGAGRNTARVAAPAARAHGGGAWAERRILVVFGPEQVQ